MPTFVVAVLNRHRLAQGERLLAIGLRDPELVIDNRIGEPWQPATFSGAWRDFAKPQPPSACADRSCYAGPCPGSVTARPSLPFLARGRSHGMERIRVQEDAGVGPDAFGNAST